MSRFARASLGLAMLVAATAAAPPAGIERVARGQTPAVFLSTDVSDSSVVFEDPEHDFPQRVGDRRVAPDPPVAWIEGVRGGKLRRIEFSYRRAPCRGP